MLAPVEPSRKNNGRDHRRYDNYQRGQGINIAFIPAHALLVFLKVLLLG